MCHQLADADMIMPQGETFPPIMHERVSIVLFLTATIAPQLVETLGVTSWIVVPYRPGAELTAESNRLVFLLVEDFRHFEVRSQGVVVEGSIA